MESTLQPGDLCPDCQCQGLTKRIRYFYINPEERIMKCESDTCLYPYEDNIVNDGNGIDDCICIYNNINGESESRISVQNANVHSSNNCETNFIEGLLYQSINKMNDTNNKAGHSLQDDKLNCTNVTVENHPLCYQNVISNKDSNITYMPRIDFIDPVMMLSPEKAMSSPTIYSTNSTNNYTHNSSSFIGKRLKSPANADAFKIVPPIDPKSVMIRNAEGSRNCTKSPKSNREMQFTYSTSENDRLAVARFLHVINGQNNGINVTRQMKTASKRLKHKLKVENADQQELCSEGKPPRPLDLVQRYLNKKIL